MKKIDGLVENATQIAVREELKRLADLYGGSNEVSPYEAHEEPYKVDPEYIKEELRNPWRA